MTEKYIWKRILVYTFYSLYFIGWFLWLLTLGHPVSSTPLYLGPTFYLPSLNQPKNLIIQSGLVLPAWSSLSRMYLELFAPPIHRLTLQYILTEREPCNLAHSSTHHPDSPLLLLLELLRRQSVIMTMSMASQLLTTSSLSSNCSFFISILGPLHSGNMSIVEN